MSRGADSRGPAAASLPGSRVHESEGAGPCSQTDGVPGCPQPHPEARPFPPPGQGQAPQVHTSLHRGPPWTLCQARPEPRAISWMVNRSLKRQTLPHNTNGAVFLPEGRAKTQHQQKRVSHISRISSYLQPESDSGARVYSSLCFVLSSLTPLKGLKKTRPAPWPGGKWLLLRPRKATRFHGTDMKSGLWAARGGGDRRGLGARGPEPSPETSLPGRRARPHGDFHLPGPPPRGQREGCFRKKELVFSFKHTQRAFTQIGTWAISVCLMT